MAKFKLNKFVEAMQMMEPLKASGKDGFPTFFYKKYQHIVGNDVARYCSDMLNGQIDVKEINRTNLVLIPKVAKLKSMGKFRPIRLCNVIYKIIWKVAVNIFGGTTRCIHTGQTN